MLELISEFFSFFCVYPIFAGGVDVVKGVAGTVGVGGEMVVFFGHRVGTVEDGEGGVAGAGGEVVDGEVGAGVDLLAALEIAVGLM